MDWTDKFANLCVGISVTGLVLIALLTMYGKIEGCF